MAATRIHPLILLAFVSLPSAAAVLPDDRADVLYHSYDGGGMRIDGPTVLVRKKVDDSVSLSVGYYVDSVSGASVDVIMSGASPIKEERTEKRLAIDYLRGKTLMSGGFAKSEENDFTSDTMHINLSQSFFGDLTTLTLGYGVGQDEVRKSGQPDFREHADRRTFSVGLSQVLTKRLLLDAGWETKADQGYLSSPYRSVRYLDPGSANGYALQSEVYPQSHGSNALLLRAIYYLPRRASLQTEYRHFNDTWGVVGQNVGVTYTQPWRDWVFDARYRYYTQTSADFYSDLFPYANAQNYMSRDKELAAFHDHSIGVGASYEFTRDWHFVDHGTVNLRYDHIQFDYDDFRDITKTAAPGEEPLYSFHADVVQLFVSLWY